MGRKTYRIGEAAEMLHLKSYVLRFWETEFAQLAPLRTSKGQRLYSENDIALLRRIQSLLHEKGMTIDGARRVLAGEQAEDVIDSASADPAGGADAPDDGVAGLHGVTAVDAAPKLDPAVLGLLREELMALRALLTQETRS